MNMKYASIYLKWLKKALWCVLILVVVLMGCLSVLLNGAAEWLLDTWGLLSIDEIIFHLKVPLEGTNSDVIQEFIIRCIPPTVLCLFLAVVILVAVRGSKKGQGLFLIASGVISIVVCLFSANHVWKELNVGDFIEDQKQISMFIDKNYKDPRNTNISFPEQKRNLIYIYLESMESTYADKENGGAYDDNYIPELTKIADNNINFSGSDTLGGGYTATGSTWTIGGMFAQTSGLPLKLEIDGNAMSTQDDFLPDIRSLGDILEEQGYRQTLMLGSDATFGGRRNYFGHHGNYEMWDNNTAKELEKIPEDYEEWWGYEDEKLFTYAQEKLSELGSGEEPFNFTMLTADTHFEDGYVCQLCQDEFPDNQYADVMACSSRQLASFISWIQEQPFYENTTVILSGDHLTMDSNFCEEIDENYARTVYNAFLNSAVTTENFKNRQFNTMDMFPTTLASLGVTIDGDSMALGTNLFSEKPTLTEEFGIEKINSELAKKSLFYNYLTKDVDESKAESE